MEKRAGAEASGRKWEDERADSPQRTCIGCRRVASGLGARPVFAAGPGGLEVGPRVPGGVHGCAGRPVECLDQAMRRAVARALRGEVRSDDVERCDETVERPATCEVETEQK